MDEIDIPLNVRVDREFTERAVAAVIGSSLSNLARSLHGQPVEVLVERIVDAVMPQFQRANEAVAYEFHLANQLADALREVAPDHPILEDYDISRVPMARI